MLSSRPTFRSPYKGMGFRKRYWPKGQPCRRFDFPRLVWILPIAPPFQGAPPRVSQPPELNQLTNFLGLHARRAPSQHKFQRQHQRKNEPAQQPRFQETARCYAIQNAGDHHHWADGR